MKTALIQQLEDVDPADLIRRASDAGADIAVFPEMFSNGYRAFDADDPASETA